MFSIVTLLHVVVNGKQAKRLFPDRADAQSWTTRDCFERIRPDEYDNRFDVSGLLKEGDNEILVVYENLGHAHGYVPMEELVRYQRGWFVTDRNSLDSSPGVGVCGRCSRSGPRMESAANSHRRIGKTYRWT